MTILIEELPLEVSYDQSEGTVKRVISDLLDYTKQMTVETEGAYKIMTSLYRQARDWKKIIEARRKELTEPLRRETSKINDKAKQITDPLDSVIEMANFKSSRYMLLLEQAKKKEEEALKVAAALFDADEEVYIEPLENVIRGDGAMMIKKSDKRFRLMDISKVPSKYLMVNEEAVKRDLKLGIETIPGLEIYEETTTQLRVR